MKLFMLLACLVILVPGNPKCSDLGYEYSIKIEPPVSGTYGGVVTFETDGVVATFTSTRPVGSIIVKGGPSANVFTGEAAELYAPGMKDISHVDFCYNYNPTYVEVYDLRYEDGALLWSTGSEIDSVGFNIFQNGLLAATIDPANPGSTLGSDYAFDDVRAGSSYVVEALSVDGSVHYGPVVAEEVTAVVLTSFTSVSWIEMLLKWWGR